MEKVFITVQRGDAFKRELNYYHNYIGVKGVPSIVTYSKHMIRFLFHGKIVKRHFRILAWDLFLYRRRNMEDLKLSREVTLFSVSYGSDSKRLRITA